ncbi:MAG: hypothetical protein FWE67_06520 [Planctomycetaceae bacterium]|nr:hypothetical protein [Planctomycetaceae bacterium]
MSIIRQVFDSLQSFYADKPPMVWWPEDPMEVIVGAVLVQGTTWTSVINVLQVLAEKELLNFRSLADIDEEELLKIIRPVGLQGQKAKRIKGIAQLFLHSADGNIVRFFARDLQAVRRELLSISGIGPGTADNILLYAGNLPVYMLDNYTVRILQRHRYVALNATENTVRQFIQQELHLGDTAQEVRHFSNFQALMVRTGREYCTKTKPKCGLCPLVSFLPKEGAVGVSECVVQPCEPPKPKPLKQEQPKYEPPMIIGDPELDETERVIFEQVTAEPVPIDDVIEKSGLPVHIVRALIAVLESRKILKQTAGNTVKRIL